MTSEQIVKRMFKDARIIINESYKLHVVYVYIQGEIYFLGIAKSKSGAFTNAAINLKIYPSIVQQTKRKFR